MHGTRMLTPGEVREAYGRQLINLRNESRYIFLNTLFSVSEAVLYMQMVDRLDADQIPHQVNKRAGVVRVRGPRRTPGKPRTSADQRAELRRASAPPSSPPHFFLPAGLLQLVRPAAQDGRQGALQVGLLAALACIRAVSGFPRCCGAAAAAQT